MKKIYLLTTLALLLGLTYWFIPENSGTEKVALPAQPNEENKALRAAWEKARLADPSTGEIPEGIRLLEQQFARSLPRVSDRNSAPWVSRGPYNVGGRSRALAMDVNNENRLMAGGVSGGVWLSEDAGQSWTRTTPLNAHPGCVSIAQDTRPGHTDTWYYLSGEVYGTSASATGAFYLGDGLFKSTDNGITWNPVSSTDNGNPNQFSTLFQSGWRVITNHTNMDQDELYMATIGTVYRSINGGNSWTAVLGGNTANYGYFADVAISPSGVLYAALSHEGLDAGIWRSLDGISWTEITPANFPAEFNRVVMGINPDNENEVYFLAETPEMGHYNHFISSDDWTSLWRYDYISGDGSGNGGSWTDLSDNLPDEGTEFDKFAGQGGYDLMVKVQPGTGNVFIGGTNLYRSTDGFTSKDNTTHIGGYMPGTELPYFELYPNHHPDLHDVLFLPSDPDVLLSASDGGIHRTEDCNASEVVWSSLNNAYHTSQFYTALIEKSTPGDMTIIGGLQDNGNFFSNDADPNDIWVQTINGDGAYGAILDGKTSYVLSIQQGKVAKCTIDDDGNVTGFMRIDPIGPERTDYLFINPLALDPVDQNVLYLPAGRHLYRQSELGNIQLNNEWDSISQGWTKFPDSLETDEGIISAIAVSQANPTHRVYIGTSSNKLFRIDNANTGTPEWIPLTSPPASGGNVNCIAIDPDNASKVVAVYSNYNVYSMFLSNNAGQTWQKVAGNLEANSFGSGNAPSLRSLTILPMPDGSRKYFCGTSVGLYSADTLLFHSFSQPGTQWTLEAPDLIGSSVVDYMDSRAVDGWVVAATHGSGLFTANFGDMVSNQEPELSTEFRIFPNPVKSRLNIEYTQAEKPVPYRIFDLKGRLLNQGILNSQLEGIGVDHLNPGTYLCSLQINGRTISKKFIKVANR